MEMKWREAVEMYFKDLFQDLPIETEGSHERRLSEYLFSRSILEIRTYRIRSRSRVFWEANTAFDVFQAAEFRSST
jgi:hypothetical protein